MHAKIIIALIVLAAISIVDGLSIKTQSHAWIGYSPDCSSKCAKVGTTCSIGKENICCTKDQCNSKYGYQTCQTPLIVFSCDPAPSLTEIQKIIDPAVYPNLYNP